MGGRRGGIDKAASSWTPCGGSPPWTLEAVTLRGLKSPLPWMYDCATYRNHVKNHSVSLMRLISLPYSFTLHLQVLNSAATHLELHV